MTRIEETEERLEVIDEEMVAASDYGKIKELNEEKNNLNKHMKQTSQDGVNLRK